MKYSSEESKEIEEDPVEETASSTNETVSTDNLNEPDLVKTENKTVEAKN